MRVIVTAGGTEEPVDGVRRLTNVSTGDTGAAIATHFAAQGAEVLLLHAARARLEHVDSKRETFVTFADLASALERHLTESEWDAVIHLAAVSDYSVASVEIDGKAVAPDGGGKIAGNGEVVIRLSPNPKIIDSLRGWSTNPAIRIVGFKLTNDPNPAARTARVRALAERGVADLVVHNDLSEITEGRHPTEIWSRQGPFARAETKQELAGTLYDLLRADSLSTDLASKGSAPTETIR